jgi:hypothetical protein
MFPRSPEDRWIDALSDEDVAFLRRFLLASGSLKDVAAAYGVSYPSRRCACWTATVRPTTSAGRC